MVSLEVDVTGMTGQSFAEWLDEKIRSTPADSIVRIKVNGKLNDTLFEMINAENLRSLTPQTVNIAVRLVDYNKFRRTSTTSITE